MQLPYSKHLFPLYEEYLLKVAGVLFPFKDVLQKRRSMLGGYSYQMIHPIEEIESFILFKVGNKSVHHFFLMYTILMRGTILLKYILRK